MYCCPDQGPVALHFSVFSELRIQKRGCSSAAQVMSRLLEARLADGHYTTALRPSE